MKPSQVILSWILFFLLCCFLTLLFHWSTRPERPIFVAISGVLFGIVTIMVIGYESIYVLRPDTMIVASFLGNMYRLCAPVEGVDQGELDSGIVIIFPPWLSYGQIYPLPAFNVAFEGHGANTVDGATLNADGTRSLKDATLTPVTVGAQLTIQLAPNLAGIKKLAQTFPVLEKYWDLTEMQPMSFLVLRDGIRLAPEMHDAPRIAHVLKRELDQTWNEAINRATPQFTLNEAMSNDPDLEAMVYARLQELRTLTARAGFFLRENNPTSLFDVNILGTVPSDAKTAEAVSAETRERLVAKGVVEEGRGRAKATTEVALAVSAPGGREALAANTMQHMKIDNMTLITDAQSLLPNFLGTHAVPPSAPAKQPASTTPTPPSKP